MCSKKDWLSLIQNCMLKYFLIVIFFSSAANDTIDHLDLSWNHLRNKGACAVALSLKVC